ncbi:glycosyltransferase family 2 protein [Desulfopila aestuarii]|uniref:Glycosyltransferase, GT2 family n=1 Tax=Desulfopila aestuarii DSM 18488 TaxID=1121416 RepID=A0A1M7YLV2_9BACT|nr:glycosyltransferase family 2 protein [Desulfopila aestuarii]SHO53578.1 Glycosyltransferase, GT2 family [Desulfopila aestuarii DSM 18488]
MTVERVLCKDEKDELNQKLLRDKNELEIRLAETLRDYQKLQNEFAEVVNSNTWRMTYPLRTLIVRGRRASNYFNRLTEKIVSFIAGSLGYRQCVLLRANFFQNVKGHISCFIDNHFRDARIHRNTVVTRQMAIGRRERLQWYIRPSPPPNEHPLLDIGIVTYNNSKWLSLFINSLLNQQYPLDKITLIFVDHSSTDDSMSILTKMQTKYSTIFGGFTILQQENLGFGNGQNLAFNHSTAPYFLVSNVDLEFEPDAIVEIVKAAIKEGGNLGSLEFRQKPYEHPKYYDPITFDTIWSAHSCVLFRREALKTVGGYENKIFMYGEDTELSYRLKDHGFSVKYCPKSVVWHYYYRDNSPEELKPFQFKGNIIANSFIRLRYGSMADILQIPIMYLQLMKDRYRDSNQWQDIAECFCIVVKNIVYFLGSRKKSNVIFPFYNWDFERRRSGDFYKQHKCPNKNIPLVSVIVRTSPGRGHWLCETLITVATQTYSNIELIIIDQEGTTIEPMANQLCSSINFPFPFYYHTVNFEKRSSAWNKGASLSKGDYLVFLEDTDLLFADHVEILVNGLLNNKNYLAAYSSSIEVSYISNTVGDCQYYEIEYNLDYNYQRQFDRSVLLNKNYIHSNTVIINRSLYSKNGGFDENMEGVEDWDLWLRCSCMDDFLFIDKTTSLSRTASQIEI